MSVEQVARDFMSTMGNPDRVRQLFTPDAIVDGGVLPRPLPATEAMSVMIDLTSAIPDLRMDVQHVTVNGNQARVDAVWSGTQSRSLSLPVPGMMPIPATGKHISVKDTYILTVEGDKISHMTVESPADGGIPGALSQIGVHMPPQ